MLNVLRLKPIEQERKPVEKHQSAIIAALFVIAFAAVLNLVATAYYTKTTSEIFGSSYRPYVGISAVFFVPGPGANSTLHVSYKNFGTIPAVVGKSEWRVTLNGAAIPVPGGIKQKNMLFAGMRGELTGLIPADAMKTVRMNQGKLDVEVWIRYRGLRNRDLTSYQKSEFNSLTRNFDVINGSFE